MLIPSAPRASAAARPRPSANPPLAMTGNGELVDGGWDQHQAADIVLARMAGALEAVD
jgi:hypothetical protein